MPNGNHYQKLCPECRAARPPNEREMLMLAACRYADASEMAKNHLFYQAEGCMHCNNSGYAGRVGIFELLVASPAVKSLIRNGADVVALRETARMERMADLFEDGINKALRGIVAFENVYKICPQ